MPRTVVVTGASSFVGHHIARAFADAGHRVVATHSRPRDTYDGIGGERLKAIESHVALAQLDITDGGATATLIDRETPSLWIHHAGFATHYASPDYNRDEAQRINVEPLGALYRHLENGSCGVIVTGSSAEYEPSLHANREDDVCRPDTPYGASKLAETNAAQQLAERHAVPTRIARLYIPFGSLDNPQKLLSQVVDALRRGQPVDLSPCEQARDFMSVSDVSKGYLALASDLPRTRFDIFNLSSGIATRLRDLLETIADRLNADPALLHFGAIPMRPGEAPVSFGDNAKARSLLDWSPRRLGVALDEDLLSNIRSNDKRS